MTIEPGWPVAIALAALLLVALGAHRVAGYGLERSATVAAVRVMLQLTLVALIIGAVVDDLALSIGFVVVMFGVAVLTTVGRVNARRASAPAALAIAAGVVPVLVITLASRAVPMRGIALIPIAGIVIGNAMTAHTLVGRRSFAALREETFQYEAGLSLGLSPAQAIIEIIHRRAPEALFPVLDQTRTTGLVALPGAFIGVMLGGGSPAQAATAQVLVLFGVLAAQTITVAVAERLIAARRLLPDDLRGALID